jgi:hypothetical protein
MNAAPAGEAAAGLAAGEYDAVLRADLAAFAGRAFHELYPADPVSDELLRRARSANAARIALMTEVLARHGEADLAPNGKVGSGRCPARDQLRNSGGSAFSAPQAEQIAVSTGTRCLGPIREAMTKPQLPQT